jgi:hypothetical protein
MYRSHLALRNAAPVVPGSPQWAQFLPGFHPSRDERLGAFASALVRSHNKLEHARSKQEYQ